MAAVGMIGNLAEWVEYLWRLNQGLMRRSYFKSPKYSDITIRFGACEVQAHKLVLAQSSDFFRASFDSGFKEASAATVDLKDDDPNAMFGLLAHIYSLHFNGRNGYVKHKDRAKVSCDENGAEYVKYQVTLYITASKYLVPTLCTRVAEDFGQMLDCIVVDGGHSGYIVQIVKHIYVTHADAAVDLRGPMVTLFGNFASVWITDDWCRQLLFDVPELGVDLIATLAGVAIAVAEPRTQMVGRTAASARSKCKRG
ncbi:hypothetical protein LTR85_002422 [Meristemomyces frigidus]|nr:hypothetical protein LTR85_002422 [Meristemomyces frigidus]